MKKNVSKQKGRNKSSTLNKSGKHEKYNIDNEIVIGLNINKKVNIETPNTKRRIMNNNKTSNIIKYACIVFLVLIAILLFFMSPIFNVEEIRVNGNEKITNNECIELSQIKLEQNIYQMSKKRIKDNIRTNPYIEEVYISRKLPNIIEITIKERTANYMLELEGNEYAYINNQGYILEKSYNKIDAIILTGFSTKIENINIGSRLSDTDLSKLQTVLKIVDATQNNDLLQYITKINIADKNEYILILEEELKTVYLGDASNISTKMLYLKSILEKEKGIEGEIFINRNINTDKAYFRQKV